MKACAGLIFALACHAQISSTVSLNNGVRLQVSADLGHPTGQEQITVEMSRASGNSFYRIFWDQNHLAVYAYELAVDLTPDGKALRVSAKMATDEFARRYPNADAGKPVPTLTEDRELGTLASGQSANLGLFEIPGMGLAVSETIHVIIGGEAGGGALRLSGLRVATDDKLIAGPAGGAVAGRYAMFYIPGRGGFFFSTEPVPGRAFVKAGIYDGTRMSFTVDNIDYECLADRPIRNGGGELWVLHDASYQPAGTWTLDLQRPGREQFFVAASDSLGWWLQ